MHNIDSKYESDGNAQHTLPPRLWPMLSVTAHRQLCDACLCILLSAGVGTAVCIVALFTNCPDLQLCASSFIHALPVVVVERQTVPISVCTVSMSVVNTGPSVLSEEPPVPVILSWVFVTK